MTRLLFLGCILASACSKPAVKAIPRSETSAVTLAAGTSNDSLIVCHFPPMPSFPGGDTAFHAFMTRHLRYPAAAERQQKQGTVFVQFVVSRSGKISGFKTVARRVGYGMEEEALRVVKRMPDWEWAANDREKPEAVTMNLPIRFVLK